ncbi:MAG: hypothetical protein KC680_00620 [Candidatus Peregrinibacteria bacterium]|nr:hypothetical protein [Candidatus Peregrinibacteria bacterium]MCB9807934.1 hypothetical protein [Candidatus Peribacteria bacterium]
MRILLITTLITFLASPMTVHAGDADSCRQRTNQEIAREHRLYRAYLFGKHNAKDAAINDVRYDIDGWAWIKTADTNTPWRNSHPDNQSLRWSNTVMDTQDEHAGILPIVGIFETKRVSTSELIPYLLQTIRAFECRLDALCEIARISEPKSGDDPVDIEKIQPRGCIAYEDLQTWPECHLSTVTEQADTRSYCDEIANQLVRREIELMKLVVEYDAGYRSLLQFAGNFDIFLGELRWPLAGTVRQAAELIGQLGRIPCFLSSCDIAP